MRFPADEIHLVRLGEKTRLTIPYEGRCPFKVGHYYVLEREVDVSEIRPCKVCAQTGRRKNGEPCQKCGGHGNRVHYATKVERVATDERILVLHTAKVDSLSDAQALEEGWESAEEWRDAFFATHGDAERAWTLKFELTTDVPQFLARQNGLLHPPQYVATADPDRAVDDGEAPSAESYRQWSEAAEAEQRKQREINRLEQRRTDLADKIDQLKRKAA